MLCTAVHRQARVGVAAEENKRIGFVVAQQYVVARLIELDVVMFKQQRFRLRMGDGYVNLLDLRDERFRFTGRKIATEIAGKTLFKVLRFTDIDNRTASIVHPVNAGLAGHGFQKCTGFKHITH